MHAMRAGPVLLLASLAFAACLGAAPVAPPAMPAAPLAVPRLVPDPPVVVATDSGTFEPSIAVDAEGWVYYAAPTGAQGTLWRSRDGQSFERVPILGVPPFPVGGADSDLAIVGTDHLYFVDLWFGCNTVSASHDRGQLWTNQPLGCQPFFPVDRPWLAADGPDTVWVAYNSRFGARVEKSTDGGRTFLSGGPVPNDRCTRGNLEYAPATRTLYLAGCEPSRPGVAISRDGGKTFEWSAVDAKGGRALDGFCGPCHLFPIVDTDQAGNVYYVWSDARENGTLHVWLASSRDEGRTWSTPLRVSPPNGTHLMPWVAAGRPGEVVVTWYGSDQAGSPSMVQGDWFAYAALAVDADRDSPAFHVQKLVEEPVRRGPVCVRGLQCQSTRSLGDFFEAAFGPDGKLHVALVDSDDDTREKNDLLYVRAGITPTGT